MSSLARPPGQVTSILLQPHQVPAGEGASVEGVPLCTECQHGSPGSLHAHLAPISPLGTKGGVRTPTDPTKSPPPPPQASPCISPASARLFFLFIPFSVPECALLALAARGRGEPLSPPRSRGSPRQMGPGEKNAHTLKPLRGFAGAPFIASLCVPAPLRWDAPRASPPAPLPCTPEEKKVPIKALFVGLV